MPDRKDVLQIGAAKPNEVVNSTGSWSEAEEAPNNAQLFNELAFGYSFLISFELLLPNAGARRDRNGFWQNYSHEKQCSKSDSTKIAATGHETARLV
jgi:hypothetical protein